MPKGIIAKPGDTNIVTKGYVVERTEDGRWVRQNRLVWERHNGPIPPRHVVHHINGDKRDNRIENLALMTVAEHQSLHLRERPKEWHMRQIRTMHESPNHPMNRNTCRHGHPYTPENIWRSKEGWRQCRTCHRLHYLKRKAEGKV